MTIAGKKGNQLVWRPIHADGLAPRECVQDALLGACEGPGIRSRGGRRCRCRRRFVYGWADGGCWRFWPGVARRNFIVGQGRHYCLQPAEEIFVLLDLQFVGVLDASESDNVSFKL